MQKLGLSFSYGGAYVGYYYGVFEYLYDTFDLTSVSYYAGVSAGCQVAFWLACGVPPSTAWDRWFIPTFSRACTATSIFGSLCAYPRLRRVALHNLGLLYEPSMLEACNRSLYVGVTVLNNMRPESIHAFADQHELFGSLLASQCVPFLFDTHVMVNRIGYVDGALSHATRYEPCDASWIHISVFDWEPLSVLGSLASLCDLHSIDHHTSMKARGFDAARRRHRWFEEKGLKRRAQSTLNG
jgi:hypothetical protein